MSALDLTGQQRVGRRHFALDVGGQNIAYAYIRKNACSAFKRLFMAESPHSDGKADALGVMGAHHVAGLRKVATADVRVCVLRDPIDRILSVWRNKWIQDSGNADIFRSYTTLVGGGPRKATFTDFVEKYLSQPHGSLDAHVWTQSSHLMPVRYDVAVDISGLHSAMTDLLGADIADAHFARRRNVSSGFGESDEPVSDVPAHELTKRFAQEKLMPSRAALLTPSLEEQLTSLYADDLVLHQTLG